MNRLTVALGAVPLLLGSFFAQAQTPSPKLTISNAGTDGTQIPLDPNSTVQIDAAGDLTVSCLLNGQNVCPGLAAGGETGVNPPTATLTAGVTTIEAGQPLQLTWTSTGADACVSSGPSNATSWTGVIRNPGGNASVSNLVEGEYTFQLRCYSAGGSTTVSSALVTVTESTTPLPADYCAEYYDGTPAMPTGAQFNAHGFTKAEATFTDVFGIAPGGSYTSHIGVPSVHLSPVQTRYLAIPFVMTAAAGPDSQMQLTWIDGGQLVSGGALLLTVSPCPGDFRAPVLGSPDTYLSHQCRISQPTSLSGGLTITSDLSLSGCAAPVGKKMYLNMAMYNMYTPTTPTSTTCTSGATICGVGMKIQ